MILISCGEKFKTRSRDNYDSLFLGIHFGMGKKEFYDYCWEMNRKKIFTHGPANQNVEYRLTGELEQPVSMRFYPSFHNDKIYEMPVVFTYEAWAPWNKQFSADTLLTKMLPVFEKWYGGKFKTVEHKTMGKIFVRHDGARRINLFKRDDQFVQAVFTDVKAEAEAKALEQKDNKQKDLKN